ncbi:hypothetical protein PF005_g29307, partial [Phytophthora fragariae]
LQTDVDRRERAERKRIEKEALLFGWGQAKAAHESVVWLE